MYYIIPSSMRHSTFPLLIGHFSVHFRDLITFLLRQFIWKCLRFFLFLQYCLTYSLALPIPSSTTFYAWERKCLPWVLWYFRILQHCLLCKLQAVIFHKLLSLFNINSLDNAHWSTEINCLCWFRFPIFPLWLSLRPWYNTLCLLIFTDLCVFFCCDAVNKCLLVWCLLKLNRC